MPKTCIIRKNAEDLKRDFRSGKISFSFLYNLGSSKARIKFFEQYVGEGAKFLTTTIEKVYLSPNQKLAARNWIFKNIGEGKPLYKDLTLDQAKAMKEGLNMRDLGAMSSEERIKALSKFVDNKMATDLNDKFLRLKKSGNLPNWEARTLGTDILKQEKKLKGPLAKLEALDDLGVLSPTELKDFMASFVESKLGVDLTFEESKQLSILVKKEKEAFDKVMETNDWTWKNEKNVIDYFVSINKLKEFEQGLLPTGIESVANKVIAYMRSSILFSPRILRNSALYQAFPTVERFITKRLVPATIGDKELSGSLVQKIQSKLSGAKPSLESSKFIANQVAMATKIYNKTSFDISRMQTLNDGYSYFGGEKFQPVRGGQKLSEAEGVKEKIKTGLNNTAKFINLGPKWGAGGTDMLAANFQRADTAILMSKEIAKLESIKGKLPEGMSEAERADQLLEESYSFNPKDEQAEKIRTLGILDAHLSNGTQADGMADKVLALRELMKIGKIDFGKVIIPFAKIATTVTSIGLQSATGIGIARSLYKINKASKLEGVARSTQIQEGVSSLVKFLGIMGSAVLLATYLDDDDYVGPYDSITYKELKLAQAKGAGTSAIRIGGKWIPLRFFPLINIPLAAIMTARQNKTKGGTALGGYMSGITGAILETPGFKQVKDTILGKLEDITKSKDILDSVGLDGEAITNWAKVRLIPSVLSYDVYNKLTEQDAKYDFLGREREKGGMFKEDRMNDVLLEFTRLDKDGNLPTISDPKGEYAKELEEKLGEKEYDKQLAELQQVYSEKVSELIKSDRYKNSKEEKKKDRIDDLRTKYILDKLKKLNK